MWSSCILIHFLSFVLWHCERDVPRAHRKRQSQPLLRFLAVGRSSVLPSGASGGSSQDSQTGMVYMRRQPPQRGSIRV